MYHLRRIIHQLTAAIYCLNSTGIVHAALKQPLKVKLIDSGLANPVVGKPAPCVQTLWWRAPEVMLDIPFNEVIDIWSLGVTATELRNDEHDVLSMIRDIGGQPSDILLDCGKWTPYCSPASHTCIVDTSEVSPMSSCSEGQDQTTIPAG